jgi:phosphatidylinositol dimannoside acyltransferase
MLNDPILKVGLSTADLLLGRAPAWAAYGVADTAGRTWFRTAHERRALVTENLRRVCEATGRPTGGVALRRLVERAFVEHARYYLELLRAPHYRVEEIERHVGMDEWRQWEPIMRGGAVVALAHFGNFEPYGILVAKRGIRALAPIEEIRPRVLFEFLRDRRGVGRIELVPLRQARRPMTNALKRHELVALVADRDLDGKGVPVTFFGQPTTMPGGPAALALVTGTPMMVGASMRTGHDRFEARTWGIDLQPSGDRHADTAAMTQAMARRFEEVIDLAPEQWWGAFQPIWLDQRLPREHE